MRKKLFASLLLLCLFVISSTPFAATSVPSATILERPHAGDSGLFGEVIGQQIQFTIHNTTGADIHSFAISNTDAVAANVWPTEIPPFNWTGRIIERTGNNWNDLFGNNIPELTGLMTTESKAFYYSIISLGGFIPPNSAIANGQMTDIFWGLSATGPQSQFVTVGKDSQGVTVISQGVATVVPLPASLLLFLSGMCGMSFFRWKNSRKSLT